VPNRTAAARAITQVPRANHALEFCDAVTFSDDLVPGPPIRSISNATLFEKDSYMAISDKTRKLLWGKSGNRCAICRRELVIEATSLDDESVVGDECHIISGQSSGPRHDPAFSQDLIDEPENLILLCKVHHKQIDDQHETYTVELLRLQKANHERWVSEKLSEEEQQPAPIRVRRIKENIPAMLVRIASGQDLLRATDNTLALAVDHGSPSTESEMELVSGFFQQLQDWDDIGNDLGPGERIRMEFQFTERLKELEAAGFWLFAAREVRRLEGGIAQPTAFPTVILKLVRSTDPGIQSINLKPHDAPQEKDPKNISS